MTTPPGTWDKKEIWSEKAVAYEKGAQTTWLKLEEISCPSCAKLFEVKSFKLRDRLGHFSKLTCKRCGAMTASHLWQCDCGERWTKCRLHQHFPTKYAPRATRKRTIRDDIGIDVSQPKVREICTERFVAEDNGPTIKRIRLNAGGRLAAEFPHFV